MNKNWKGAATFLYIMSLAPVLYFFGAIGAVVWIAPLFLVMFVGTLYDIWLDEHE